MPSSAADRILSLLQEQLEHCTTLEATAEKVLSLLQSGETEEALRLFDERQRLTSQIQSIEDCLGQLQAGGNSAVTPKLPRRFRTVAESIGESVKRQLELEDEISEELGRLAANSGRTLGELEEGGRLVSSYAEGLAEGSGVDLVIT